MKQWSMVPKLRDGQWSARAALLAAALVLSASPCWASISLVQHTSSAQGASPQSVTFASAVGASNTIVCLVASASFDANQVLSCADNNSNTYTCSSTVYDATNTTDGFRACCVANPTLTTNPPTITGSVSSNDTGHMIVNIREYSGLACTTDGQTGSASSGVTTMTTNNVTTTATDLLVAAFLDSTCGSITGAGSGWGNADISNGARNWIFEDQLNAASGTYSGSATKSCNSANWGGGVMAFKASGGGGGATAPPTQMMMGCCEKQAWKR